MPRNRDPFLKMLKNARGGETSKAASSRNHGNIRITGPANGVALPITRC